MVPRPISVSQFSLYQFDSIRDKHNVSGSTYPTRKMTHFCQLKFFYFLWKGARLYSRPVQYIIFRKITLPNRLKEIEVKNFFEIEVTFLIHCLHFKNTGPNWPKSRKIEPMSQNNRTGEIFPADSRRGTFYGIRSCTKTIGNHEWMNHYPSNKSLLSHVDFFTVIILMPPIDLDNSLSHQ